MSVTAEDWEKQKTAQCAGGKVQSAPVGGQGHADFVPLINGTTRLNHMFPLSLSVSSLTKRYQISHCTGKKFIL